MHFSAPKGLLAKELVADFIENENRTGSNGPACKTNNALIASSQVRAGSGRHRSADTEENPRPIDFSEFSDRALQYAARVAKEFKAELLLLHVVEAFPIDYMLGIKSAEEANQWQVEQSEKRIRKLCVRLLSENSLVASGSVKFGKPFQEIVRFVRRHQIDLIIMATHGYTGLKHIQLGSTAEMVIRHASCPVLVLRNPDRQSTV